MSQLRSRAESFRAAPAFRLGCSSLRTGFKAAEAASHQVQSRSTGRLGAPGLRATAAPRSAHRSGVLPESSIEAFERQAREHYEHDDIQKPALAG